MEDAFDSKRYRFTEREARLHLSVDSHDVADPAGVFTVEDLLTVRRPQRQNALTRRYLVPGPSRRKRLDVNHRSSLFGVRLIRDPSAVWRESRVGYSTRRDLDKSFKCRLEARCEEPNAV